MQIRLYSEDDGKIFAPFDLAAFVAVLQEALKEPYEESDGVNSLIEQAMTVATGNVTTTGQPFNYCWMEFLKRDTQTGMVDIG